MRRRGIRGLNLLALGLAIVSLAGITAVPREAVYAAPKHAAIGFSLSTCA